MTFESNTKLLQYLYVMILETNCNKTISLHIILNVLKWHRGFRFHQVITLRPVLRNALDQHLLASCRVVHYHDPAEGDVNGIPSAMQFTFSWAHITQARLCIKVFFTLRFFFSSGTR